MKEIANKYAPIVLFCYKRLETLIQTVEALQKNYLASESDLIVFSDAARSESDAVQVNAVRDYIKDISGFRSLSVNYARENKGLAASIIYGVSSVLEEHEHVIVLEDDLITSLNFLNFMNNALMHYEDNQQILSISGYSPAVEGLKDNDVYFTQRSSSWGWAT